jgi:hypothetical protein
MILKHCKRAGGTLSVILIAIGLATAPQPALAQGSKCIEDAASIRRAENQLPRLEIAPPGDQQIVCITLETNILFARRMSAHLAQCPRSPHARNGDTWQRTGSQYTAQFGERRCKPAIRGYRG